ncbi:MAG: serine/threonine protein kinase [Deltaproteobacteria bacterium]|jgi:serine/threonine-protein kinase|nr:serine/threonine protein kinase [Deltaproteobacteria bacterium]MBW2537378.1 serine/threonine protein kinase [Deltaproteobacteria bacterium]
MIGTLVGRKYMVLRRIGKGGMGAVFEAEHEATGRRVALKVLSKSLLTEDDSFSDVSESLRADYEETVLRFEREARVAARIESEHVVQILDAGREAISGRPYLVMELLRGDNVSQAFKRHGALRPDTALRIAAQACEGLMAAHQAGVVHRDIKMGNLLLAERGQGRLIVKVLDFGIARVRMEEFHKAHQDPLTRTGSVLGSPQYMAPEQASGLKSLDHRADIWSLSVVLYRALSGKTPFDEATLGALILALHTKTPTPLQDVAPWVSPRIAAIVHRGLQRDPNERFATAGEMLSALLELLPDGTALTQDQIVGVSDEERAAVAERYAGVSAAATAELATRITAESSETHLEFRTSSPPPRRKISWPVWVGLVVVLLVAGGLTASRLLGDHGPGAAESSPVASTAPSAAPWATGSASATAEAAPAQHEAAITVDPRDAKVEVDGQVVENVDGVVLLSGTLGSIHPVTLRDGKRKRTVDVVITEQGAKPSLVSIGKARTGRPATAAAKPTAPAAAVTAAPKAVHPPPTRPPASPKPGHVGATESFE